MVNDAAAGAAEPLDDDPRRVGPYELLGRLGDGGMGSVYLGRGSDGGRLVAVKVIRGDLAREPEFRARFLREAQAAQRVARFCTAEVLDVDTSGRRPYLVTEYVAGPTLSDAVRRVGPLPPGDLERLGVAVASALTAIHAAGLVHRDLKPGNIILSPSGTRVIDFGIARAMEAATQLTATGAGIGTPAFMSPEQAMGHPVTAAADVYAWGGVMLFAGTARLPFGEGATPVVLLRVVSEEPDFTGLDAGLRPVVERAMSKNPSARPSAQELLLALVSHQPGTSPAAEAAPAAPAETVVVLGAPVATTVVEDVSGSGAPPTPSLTSLTDSTGRIRLAGPTTPPAPPGTVDEPTGPTRLAAPPPPTRPTAAEPAPILTEASSSALEVPLEADVTGVTELAHPTADLTPTADGSATPGATPVPEPLGPRRRRRRIAAATAAAVVLSGISLFVATRPNSSATAGGVPLRVPTVELSAAAGKPVVAHDLGLRSLAFSPDGSVLASGSADDAIRLWKVVDRTGLAAAGPAFTDHTGGEVRSLAFSPDGATLASSPFASAQLWDVRDPARTTPLGKVEDGGALAFAPTGQFLVTGSYEGWLRIWDTSGPSVPAQIGAVQAHQDTVRSVAVSPDSATVATSSDDGTVRLWDARDRSKPTLRATVPAVTDELNWVRSVTFSSNGRLVAAGSRDGLVRLWDVSDPARPASVATLAGFDGWDVFSVAISPDSRRLAAGSSDSTIRLWEISDPTRPAPLGDPLRGHTNTVVAVAFSPDGTTLASGSDDHTVRIWDLTP